MDKTSKLGLNLPEKGLRDWDVPINENFNLIDSKVAVLGLNNTFTGSNTFTTRLITKNNGAHQVYTTDKNSEYTIDNACAYREDGVTPWFFVGAQKNPNGNYYQRIGIWNNDNTAFAAINVGFKPDGSLFTEVPVPSTSDNSSNIATTSWIRKLFALLTGNNTFSGLNRYTGAVRIKHPNDDSTVAPAEQIYYQWGMEDKNGVWLGGFEGNHLTDGTYSKGMYVKQQGGEKWGSLIIGIKPDGSEFTRAPTPATSDNSTNIATTAFVNNKFQVVSALPSSPTADVFYFIKG